MNQRIVVCIYIITHWMALTFSQLVQAKVGRINSFLTLSTQYSTYNDLQLSAGETSALSPSYDAELAFKTFKSFYLLVVGTKALDDTRQGFGLGARIDLPGIFFFGADSGSFRARSKKFPVNTSAYVQSLLVTNQQEQGTTKRSVVSRYGLTLELFIFNDITYILTDASLFTIEGNSYATYSVGLGFEF